MTFLVQRDICSFRKDKRAYCASIVVAIRTLPSLITAAKRSCLPPIAAPAPPFSWVARNCTSDRLKRDLCDLHLSRFGAAVAEVAMLRWTGV
jgi:hypothetical protein